MITRNLTISSTYESLRNATNAVRSVLSEAGIADEVIGICELAVQELLTNLVEHAYKEDTTKSIKILSHSIIIVF